jgi:hypothetical protein
MLETRMSSTKVRRALLIEKVFKTPEQRAFDEHGAQQDNAKENLEDEQSFSGKVDPGRESPEDCKETGAENDPALKKRGVEHLPG